VNSERIATGEEAASTSEYIDRIYPSPHEYAVTDENWLTQLQLPSDSKIYQVNGRSYQQISPVINGKRYLLSSSTIDSIDEQTAVPQITVELGEQLGFSGSYAGLDFPMSGLSFVIEPSSLLAIIYDYGCAEMGCGELQRAWLIDLNNKQVVKKYVKTDGLPGNVDLISLKIRKEGNVLILSSQAQNDVFSINIDTMSLTSLLKE
jgi:hypothetical protein